MPRFTDVAIIYNPNSTGNAEANAKQLKNDLTAGRNIPVSLLPTERAGHAIELAYDFAKKHEHPLIVSASGDGGYNEVINGALKAQGEGAEPICAVLPSGNANDHARTMQAEPLAELINKDSIIELDVLEISAIRKDGSDERRYAHSYAGIGLTPTVAVELNKHTLNSLKEAWIVVKTFWGLRPVVIMRDDKKLYLDSLIFSTIPEMAKVLTLSDNAQPNDGLFEVTTFRHNRKISLLLRLLKGIFGHLGARENIQKYSFTLLDPAPMQIDGEVMKLEAQTKVTVTIHKKLLRSIAAV